MEELKQDEELYRAVINSPSFYLENQGRISSAVFKDTGGCSVDRQKNRSRKDSCSFLVDSQKNNRNGIRAVAMVKVQQCYDANATVAPMPTESNEFHCEILGENGKPPLTNGQAKRLSREALLIDLRTISEQ